MKAIKTALISLVITASIAGCNVGNAPEGPSPEQFQKELATKPAVDQIRFIQGSPAPAADKAAKIEELKKKYNLTDADVAAATAPEAGPPVIPGR
jgi:hypothetical protein